MRTLILLSCVFLLLMTSLSITAQVTITQSSFPRLASFTDSAQVVENANIPIPTAGENQVWDFSFLDRGITGTDLYFDATNDPNFPDALNYTESGIDVLLSNIAIPIEGDIYESIDMDGWYRSGRSLKSTFSIPLTPFTGGANDRLDYAPANADFNGRINILNFPLNYPDQWISSRYFDIPYTATAAAFGLNQTPAFTRSTRTEQREVIGWGSLIIPQPDGSPSGKMDALLIRGEYITFDSFYLAGNPAPSALLDILGVTQGTVTDQDTFYVFYTPGFAAPVLIVEELNTAGTIGDRVLYRTQAAAFGTATKEVTIPIVPTFPNPVAAGSFVTISIDDEVSSGQVHLYDLLGQILHSIPFVAANNSAVQVEIPTTIKPGLLMMQITNEANLPIGAAKLRIVE